MAGSASAESNQLPPKDVHWSFEGPFGTYDQAQLQRGYKVYHEVCSACHSMNMIAFRNLGDKGGPFWNPKYPNPNDNPVVKAIAKDFQIADIDPDSGDPIKRPGTTADYLPNPFPNPIAARAANGGALPPDMSLLAAAREGGAGLYLFHRHRRRDRSAGGSAGARRQVLRPLYAGRHEPPTGRAIPRRCPPAASSPCRRR